MLNNLVYLDKNKNVAVKRFFDIFQAVQNLTIWFIYLVFSSDQGSSPPKRECSKEETPSQLITKLALNSPERIQKSCSRKELFPNGK